MRCRAYLLCLPLVLVLVLAPAAPADGPAAPTYDPEPLLGLLQPEARAGVEHQLGVASLADLPLYDIDQAVDDASTTFEGRLTLHYTNLTGVALRALPILLHPNAPEELGAAGGGSASMAITEVASELGPAATFVKRRPTLVEVNLAEPLAPGARLKLKVRYGGRLRALAPNANDPMAQAMSAMGSLSGTGAADYGLVGAGDGLLTLASAYPMVAPFRDGEFDVARPGRNGDLAYNGVANFRVRTVVPAGLRVVTNLVDDAPQPVGGGGGGAGAEVVASAGALVRDFVLVAGRDLESAVTRVGRTRVTSWFRRRDATAGRRCLATAAAALATYERRFGPYPWTELDVAEASIVGGAGGVEFCAMVLIAGMLYRPPSQSTSQLATILQLWEKLGAQIGSGLDGKAPAAPGSATGPAGADETLGMQLDFTVEHEVAHQYFAEMVGNDSHRWPSLDEPLAQYAAGLAYEDLHGAAAARAAMDANVKLNYAVYRMLGGADAPVLRDVTTFRTAIEYAGLVYGKAPYLYVLLRRTLGDARLDGALRAAVARDRFRIVSTATWIGDLEDGAGGPASGVRAAARRWLEEAHGDADLKVDDSGEFVLQAMFAPDVAANLRDSMKMLGMRPADLLRSMFGGGVPGDAPPGPGIDPQKALDLLDKLGK